MDPPTTTVIKKPEVILLHIKDIVFSSNFFLLFENKKEKDQLSTDQPSNKKV